jgi:hypothetical protein
MALEETFQGELSDIRAVEGTLELVDCRPGLVKLLILAYPILDSPKREPKT